MENRKEEKDESGEPADQSDVVQSSWQRGERVEHHESTCKATTEVEDEGDLSSVKRDRSVETDRIATKTARGSGTGRGSNPGRGPAERGKGRSIASSSRNSKGSRSGSDAASTSGKGKALNSGRSISSISRSSATLSSGRDMISSSMLGKNPLREIQGCGMARRSRTKTSGGVVLTQDCEGAISGLV
ncbi:hypothetical protein EUGRSUZ_C02993 [Eucalyptus grandis]|uniref:Uncharacterized protein n=2 Tax=Eucalyptus grandis TaxID=71139 RepID=A0A059CTX4_EUCGR|nr:hypothetical protein EUGRSUZ_C02993 [Eucalyptus grandis]